MPLDRDILERFPNGVFVETGAGTCLGSRLAVELGFPKIFVIEFDPAIHAKAVNRFRNTPEVEVVFGDSGKVLGEVIAPIEEPVTFWLDAHGKSPETKEHLASKPLLLELEAIAAHPLHDQHTILIDDWYVVQSEKTAKHLNEWNVRAILSRINTNLRLSLVDGLISPKHGRLWSVFIAEPRERGRPK